tara:strand:+ start:33 stop:413 length:381 start_codon:yes stop_codon:yes gene_type:complete
MVQKTNKTKSRLGREFNGEYMEAPMPRSLEMAEKCMGEGKADLLRTMANTPDFEVNEKILKTLSVSEKRFLQEHQRLHAMAKYMHEQKQEIQKAKFFRRLNKVLDKELVKPSIIIEYVNQYQRGDK